MRRRNSAATSVRSESLSLFLSLSLSLSLSHTHTHTHSLTLTLNLVPSIYPPRIILCYLWIHFFCTFMLLEPPCLLYVLMRCQQGEAIVTAALRAAGTLPTDPDEALARLDAIFREALAGSNPYVASLLQASA